MHFIKQAKYASPTSGGFCGALSANGSQYIYATHFNDNASIVSDGHIVGEAQQGARTQQLLYSVSLGLFNKMLLFLCPTLFWSM